MRTSKFFKTGLLLFVASLGLISCGDDDKEPEIVVDPVSENVEYYIEGKVVADNAALDGVSVTAGEATATTDENGQYSLTVKDRKTRSHTDNLGENNVKCLIAKGICRFVPHSSAGGF